MKFIICILLLASGPLLYAQEAPGLKDIIIDSSTYKPVYKYKAIGLSYQTTRDQALSPITFTGVGVAYTTTSWKYHNHWLWQSDFATEVLIQENQPETSLLSTSGFRYRYGALRELIHLQKGSWRFWVGPEAMMLLNTRLHSRNVNNIASYDWASSLGGAAMVSRKFKLFNRSFAFNNLFQLPLVFLYARPGYAWGIPPGLYEEEGSWTEAFQLGTLNNILLVRNQVNLDFFLRKRRKGKIVQYKAYRVAYSWNYFRINTKNSLHTGGHELSFTRVLF